MMVCIYKDIATDQQAYSVFAVSLVDGYDLPMRIDNNVGCPVASCGVDLGPNCPYYFIYIRY